MGGSQRVPIAPQVRGRLAPRILWYLEDAGWHVHRVGRAAYLHDAELHVLAGVWSPRDPAPAWSRRLGVASDGYLRRWDRCDLEQVGRLMLRDSRGRFHARLPWWRVRGPRLYSWQPPSPSLYDLGYRAAR